MRSRRRTWFQLRWPAEVTSGNLAAVLRGLNGHSTQRRRESVILVAAGTAHTVTHHLGVVDPRADGVRALLEAAIPGLAVESIDEPSVLRADRCWRCWISTRARPLDTRHTDATARGVLVALAAAGEDELLAARWVLGPVHRPAVPGIGESVKAELGLGNGFGQRVADAAAGRYKAGPPTRQLDPEAHQALREKQGQPGWQATLHLGVRATTRKRQRQLLGRLAGAFRASQGAGVQLGFRRTPKRALSRSALPARRPLLVNVDELAGIAGWPSGATADLPIQRERSRLVRPEPAVTTDKRVVAEATYPGVDRPLTLGARDALHHLHVIGPVGTGKSTLLLHLICQDMAANRSVVVLEPRGDLVHDVLQRVPENRVDDVVVLDPKDRAPVGVNPLAASDLPPDLRVDHILTIFKRLWRESWGPRSEDILTSGLLTLAATPGTSLAALPLLFTDARFRQACRARIHDPFGVDPFWQWFDALSVTEQRLVLAPVMNKVRAFLARPRLRRVIGQASPRWDIRDIHRRRPIVLVDLSPGGLGAESAVLLGSLVVSQLWQAILGRSGVPGDRRHPVMVYIDEFQTYLHLPTDLGEVLTQARGLGAGLTLAHQHLHQLRPDIQAAVLANARSRVVFATAHDDAAILMRTSDRLTPADVVGLGKYAVYASLLANGEVTPYASGRTLPPAPATCSADGVRQRSRDRWGVPAAAVDRTLQRMASTAEIERHGDGPHARRWSFVGRPRPQP